MKNIKDLSLKAKLLVLFLAVGVLPMAIVSVLSLWRSSNALEEQAYSKLIAVRDIKKGQVEGLLGNMETDLSVLEDTVDSLMQEALTKLELGQELKKSQIEQYFQQVRTDVMTLAKTEDVRSIYQKLVQYHIDTNVAADGSYDVSTPEYKAIWDQNSEYLANFVKNYGYYDVFVICAKHGHVMFTVAKESDLGENLSCGKLKDSGLAHMWRAVLETGGIAYDDFEPYAPSQGQQAAFVGYPIRDKAGEIVAVCALQLPVDRINAIVQSREGMGKTGETYLVGRDDDDGKTYYRSDRVVKDGKIGQSKTGSSITRTLAGEEVQGVKMGSTGNLELEATDKLDIPGLEWVMVSTISLEEVIAPKLAGQEKDYFGKFMDRAGYYDVFLVSPSGYVFYTVCHEPDYHTNMVDGKYASSNLGGAVREVLQTKRMAVADFAPYAPTDGAPAAFMAGPVLSEQGDVELVVALQLSLDAINAIMQQRDGMGETGETYLVGSDMRMRSDSFLDPEGHSVTASFAGTVDANGVDTEGARKGIAGETGAELIIDYNGNPVLSAYTPVKVGNTTWALLAEVDESEAFAAINAMQWMAGIVAVVGIVAIVVIALLVANSIAKPIQRIIDGLSAGATQTASASGQVSAASQSLAQGASEQAASIEETTASLEEMTAGVKQNADSAGQARQLSDSARTDAEKGAEAMGRMSKAIDDIKTSADETSKIIRTIDDIAFQTNLLALNAAVEAARAGEAGKGFAVVAEEVRGLAQRCAEAASSTSDLIEGSVQNAGRGVQISTEVAEALDAIASGSRKLNELVSEIAAASTEQSTGIEQINRAVCEMEQVTQSNAANAEESASASEELNAQAEELNRMVAQLQGLISGAATRAAETAFRSDQAKGSTPSRRRDSAQKNAATQTTEAPERSTV